MTNNNPTLVIAVILMIISVVALIANFGTLFQFWKQKGNVYKINVLMLSINLIIVSVYFIFSLLTLITIKNNSDSQKGKILIYLTIILTIILFSMIWTFLEKVALSINNNSKKLVFFGSSIKFSEIKSIIIDNEVKKIFINYCASSNIKSISLKLNSDFAKTIIDNKSWIDLEPIETNQKQWVKEYEFNLKLEK
ncbi:hypothetical protein [Spiroplasma endosymbiont of Crioceris asparagi]|uniref:hypothetical protein n=1 Tax=Spiroplasma endosymbiont of Crioceris asparagi TaxID=3066286 RepID=UPI0030CF3E09